MNTTDFAPTSPISLDNVSAASAGSARPAEPGTGNFVFHGSGSEYFKIWIVNLVLSILTIGIFSAWAKVRSQRYFHANTEFSGSRFEYHGKPRSILIGRALMVVPAVAAIALLALGNPIGLLFIVVAIVLIPWIVANSMRFRAAMVSWRGVRFSWQGSTGGVYGLTLKVVLLTIITFGIYYFAAHHRFKRLLIDNLHFGDVAFEGRSTAGEFFGPYWAFGLVTAGGTKFIDFVANSMQQYPDADAVAPIATAVTVGFLYVTYKVFAALLSKIVQNKAVLANLSFQNTSEVSELLGLYLGNLFGIAVTLGLYWPWARVREMQYRASHFKVEGDFERFRAVNQSTDSTGAVAMEAAGFLDFDVSF